MHPAHFSRFTDFVKNIHLNEIFSQLGVDFSEKVYIIYSVEIEKGDIELCYFNLILKISNLLGMIQH